MKAHINAPDIIEMNIEELINVIVSKSYSAGLYSMYNPERLRKEVDLAIRELLSMVEE